jgi:hypothetical protein
LWCIRRRRRKEGSLTSELCTSWIPNNAERRGWDCWGQTMLPPIWLPSARLSCLENRKLGNCCSKQKAIIVDCRWGGGLWLVVEVSSHTAYLFTC